jgi:dihydrofolate synthase/folylpolyglutamate synthase
MGYAKYLTSLEKFGVNLGLERIAYLLEELGDPHLKFRSIHIAGTNGKGSTAAMIASILKEAGYKVGLYTSPHLFDYTERIKINGKDIPRRDFAAGLKLVQKIANYQTTKPPNNPTVFEVLTAVAFGYFAKKKVEYAVVEVGMGGRLDATNVITPLVSVITNIDLEHTAILGRTLAKVAAEKAAIIKRGVPVITAETKPEALRVIKHNADKNRSLLIQVGSSPPHQKFWCGGIGAGLETGLIGEHQKTNAACAVAAVRMANIPASKQAVLRGLKKVSWPGRFQVLSRKPLTIADGAHNPAGIKVLVDTLRDQYPGKKFTFIFGTQEDKDSASMLNSLKPLAKKVIITHSSHQNAANKDSVSLKEVLKQTSGADRVITGSLFLVADVLKCRYRHRYR